MAATISNCKLKNNKWIEIIKWFAVSLMPHLRTPTLAHFADWFKMLGHFSFETMKMLMAVERGRSTLFHDSHVTNYHSEATTWCEWPQWMDRDTNGKITTSANDNQMTEWWQTHVRISCDSKNKQKTTKDNDSMVWRRKNRDKWNDGHTRTVSLFPLIIKEKDFFRVTVHHYYEMGSNREVRPEEDNIKQWPKEIGKMKLVMSTKANNMNSFERWKININTKRCTFIFMRNDSVLTRWLNTALRHN